MKVGIIGTGMMGSQIALRLVQKGHNVTIFNRNKSKAKSLHRTNSTSLSLANQPTYIGRHCDIALICVKDYDAVSDVSFKKGGFIENPNENLIVLQCSTISPDESHKIADAYSSKGIKIVSAPILTGITTVQRGGIDNDCGWC